MESHYLFYRSQRVYYSTIGVGEPLFLIHGYQTDSRIWKYLIPLLSKKFTLVIPDLPGHGKSPLIQVVNSMDFLADIIYRIYLSMGFNGLSIAGHSMGGYVALAFAEKNSSIVDNLYLINSHPFVDSITKILARNRESDLIDQGKKQLLLRTFLQNSFSEKNKAGLKNEINLATEIALNQPENGMLADLAGMMARPERANILKDARYNTTIISSENELSASDSERMKYKNLSIKMIPECGHLSIFEKPKEVSKAICS
jgi:pimeloyl-ACP methyl ester carboxylesterase